MTSVLRNRDMNAHGTQQQSQAVEGLRRKELRIQIRSLAEETQQNKETLQGPDASEKLGRHLRIADDLHAQIQKPREEMADACVFSALVTCGTAAAKKAAQGGQNRTPAEFLRALKLHYVRGTQPQEDGEMEPDAFGWSELGQEVAHLFKSAPQFHCMLGPLDAQQKVRKAAKPRAPKQAQAALTRPDEVTALDEKEKQETDEVMAEMWSKLRNLKQSRVPELICNMKSFGQTIENMFTLSFLVKDGKVRLQRDEQQGLVAVALMAADGRPAGSAGGGAQSQFVFALQQADWQRMTAIVAAKDCVITHREEHDASGSGGGGSGGVGKTKRRAVAPDAARDDDGAGPSAPPSKRRTR